MKCDMSIVWSVQVHDFEIQVLVLSHMIFALLGFGGTSVCWFTKIAFRFTQIVNSKFIWLSFYTLKQLMTINIWNLVKCYPLFLLLGFIWNLTVWLNWSLYVIRMGRRPAWLWKPVKSALLMYWTNSWVKQVKI